MATTVRYNGILLHNVVTRRWDQEVTYEQSGTDVIYQRFRLSFQGVMHTGPKYICGVYKEGAATPTLRTAYGDVVRRLGQARKLLEVWVGPLDHLTPDHLILTATPYVANSTAPETVDVDNGPHPKNVNVTHIAGEVLRVEFTVECCLLLCDNNAGPTQIGQILSNRWKIDESMDANFYTTRTISGRLRIAGAGTPGHFFKYLVVPPLEMGFKREAVTYGVTENGLDCEYEVRDRQVHTSAPWPATKISGTHTESTVNGATYASEMSIRLTGSPDASKADLITRAVQIVDSRLRITAQKDKDQPDFILRHAAIIDHIGEENMVEFRVQLEQVPDLTGLVGGLHEYLTNTLMVTIGQPLSLPDLDGRSYDPRISTLPNLWGYDPQTGDRNPSAALYVLHCFLQTPCLPSAISHAIRQDVNVSTEEHDPGTTDIEGGIIDRYSRESDSPGHYSDDTKEAFYTQYELQNTYTTRKIRVQAPLAIEAEDGEDTSHTFTLASGQCVREIKLEGERVGKWPQIPEPLDEFTDGTLRGLLINHHEQSYPPSLSVDGRHKIFKIDAYYRWAMNRPPTSAEETKVGVLPFTDYEQSDTVLKRTDIYSERLEP